MAHFDSDDGGSIPACAGEPPIILRMMKLLTVYPRVCGGAPPRTYWLEGWDGLSPRVRGSQTTRKKTLSSRRSIPACAGEPLEDAIL